MFLMYRVVSVSDPQFSGSGFESRSEPLPGTGYSIYENKKYNLYLTSAVLFNKLTSVFHASVPLLIMNFVITLSK